MSMQTPVGGRLAAARPVGMPPASSGGAAAAVPSATQLRAAWSLDCNGTSTIGTAASLLGATCNAFTLSMRVKPDDVANSYYQFLGFGVISGSPKLTDNGAAALHWGGGVWTLNWKDADADWVHLMLTQNTITPSAVNSRLYVNGIRAAPDDPASFTSLDYAGSYFKDDTWRLGQNGWSTYDKYYNGKITDVAVWNAVLDYENVQAVIRNHDLVNHFVPDLLQGFTVDGRTYDKHPNLKAWWRFAEGTGTTCADSSGNGKTLTLTDPTWSADVP